MRIYTNDKKHNVLNMHASRRDAVHLHVTIKTQINLHSTQKIHTTMKKYYKTIITS